jgi:uncharacterized protein (TIGR02099 family)
MRTSVQKLLRALEILAWAAFFACAIGFLAVRYWLVPSAERYREDIVAAISRGIGLPVKIGALSTDWQGLRPRLSITDVRVFDSGGREALVLPAVMNVVAWRSLFVGELRLHSFVIDGPKLVVQRDVDGNIIVGGIKLSTDKGDGRLGDWILSQSQIIVRSAEIEWQDEMRKAPPLKLTALNFRLDNDGDEHSVGIMARPPRELGPGIDLRARLEGGSVRQAAKWNGRLYAEFGYTDLAGWRPWVDYPLDVRRGEGALRIWATMTGGRISQATADVALSNVSARLGRELPVLEISAVHGRVYGRETARGYDFGVRSLSLQRPGAPPMNGTSFRASWEPASSTSLVPKGSMSANLVELGPLAHLAEYLPFPTDLRALLAELAPQGNLLDAKFDWTGVLPDRASYTARTRFAGLTMKAWRSIPGFANLSGSLEANETKGTLTLASRKSELDLPKVFPEPRIALDALNGEVAWDRTPAGVAVRLSNLNYANEDLAGTAYGNYAWTGDGPGVVDLSVQLARADGKATARYLPLSAVMGARTREWVANGVLAGKASDVRLRLKGDLRDFPFVDPQKGQFLVTAKVTDAVLDYAAGWPRIEAIDANLAFERDKIEITGQSGTILDARLANVRVTLPSMLDPDPRLIVEGSAEGATAAFLDYIRESPVRRMIGGFTDAMASLGRGKLHLRLELKLREMDKSRIAGDFQFAGNSITVDARLPPIQRAGGRIGFTESSLTIGDTRGQLLGGEVRISGGSRPDAGVVVAADGRATVEGLRALLDHPWRRRLAGSLRYLAAVTIKEGRTQLTLDSTLEGLSSALPAPLSKSASEVLPLRVEVFPGEGRDRISVALGPPTGRIITADFLRAALPGEASGSTAAGAGMQLQRTLVMLNPVTGETPLVPERRGTTVRGSLPALDLDRWQPLIAESGTATGAPGAGDGAGYDVKIGVLDAMGKRMRSVALQGVADASGWSASVSTAEFAGDVVYRGESGGRLVARFTRFTLPEESPGAKPGEGFKELPAVDIVADNFVHRGRKLGRVEVQARHEGRDWRIEKAAVTNSDSALSGSGLWRAGDVSRTSLAFKLDVSDVGLFLDRVGSPDHIKGGRAKLDATLNWNGDPLTMDYATLSGALKMQVEDGQFLEIEPGIGKLVSLMSLQMLPRRVTMDFRDVFSKGFQFDRITSNTSIERGVMAVKEFHMNGPAADVTMNGQVDLSLETQNLTVKVIPQLGDSASTVVGLVNPIAGVATLIAGRLMKNPLGKMFAFEYAISGTWTDPKVEKLQPATQSLSAPADLGFPNR